MHGVPGKEAAAKDKISLSCKESLKGNKMAMTKFWMKAQKINQDTRNVYVVAVCDEKLLGKKLNEYVTISEHFYKDKLVGAEEVVKALEKATTANIFGNEAVKLMIKSGVVDSEDVKEIAGIKYAMIFSLD
jgi:hypothetical protein